MHCIILSHLIMMICFVLDLLLIIDFKNARCSSYVITPTDVSISVDHLKYGKGDGYEGVCSDHFINGTKILDMFLSIIFTLFYTRFIDFRYDDTHTQG